MAAVPAVRCGAVPVDNSDEPAAVRTESGPYSRIIYFDLFIFKSNIFTR